LNPIARIRYGRGDMTSGGVLKSIEELFYDRAMGAESVDLHMKIGTCPNPKYSQRRHTVRTALGSFQ
jgi:hypothetical protein